MVCEDDHAAFWFVLRNLLHGGVQPGEVSLMLCGEDRGVEVVDAAKVGEGPR